MLTQALLLSAASVVFCWFYGAPALYCGIQAFRKVLPFTKKGQPKSKQTVLKLRWALFLSIAGVAMSSFFTIIYTVALFTGAYISLW
jgi:hypothetical protein